MSVIDTELGRLQGGAGAHRDGVVKRELITTHYNTGPVARQSTVADAVSQGTSKYDSEVVARKLLSETILARGG